MVCTPVMRGKCYAHSRPGEPPETWQHLADHLTNVAVLAAKFAAPFSSGDWAWNAGWLHDLGKAAAEFQAYLLRENGLDDAEYDGIGSGRINHSSAGAAFAEERFAQAGIPIGHILAYLVAGHHAGLPDWYPSDTGNAALQVRLQEGRANLDRIRPYEVDVASRLRPLVKPPAGVDSKGFHLWVRMLYSCLVDADFLDTEEFMGCDQAAQRAQFAGLAELKARFDRHMTMVADSAAKTPSPVNPIRQEILAACRHAAIKPPGLFSLTVPTGGGKTLSGMAFALDHVVRHGMRRIIYVIPYTSIIEQTAAVLSGIFGSENVVEHHSNLDPEGETQRSRLAAENWDAPVIVTTNVQFFESLYAARSSRCRKLHNLVNSVVILDEAQLLPPNWLVPCVDAVNRLVDHYGVTFVLSTATQPALPGLSRRPAEIMPDPASLYAALKRTEIRFPVDLNRRVTWPEIAAELQTCDQVLCVVNKRQDCYDLFKLMPEGTIHLSALMCGQHRSEVIAEVKRRLKAGGTVRVISTQLVEAGVDMDFPVVYRALAGLDSIMQAAGRCNREGQLAAPGQVHVFVAPTDPPRGLLRKGADTTRELFAGDLDSQSPAAYTRYFALFYGKVNNTGTEWLREHLVKDVPRVRFRTAAAEFNFIDDQAQRPVIVLYRDSPGLLERLRHAGGPVREVMRRLRRYTVNLPTRNVDAMLADGRLAEIVPGIIAQGVPGLYDRQVGLAVYRQALPAEDLIV